VGAEDLSDYGMTLKEHDKRSPIALGFDVLDCPWQKVLDEMQRAKDFSEGRDKKFMSGGWRGMGRQADMILPSLAAFPDQLCILHGGLAVIFSVSVVFLF
jgi:hypothetical protein